MRARRAGNAPARPRIHFGRIEAGAGRRGPGCVGHSRTVPYAARSPTPRSGGTPTFVRCSCEPTLTRRSFSRRRISTKVEGDAMAGALKIGVVDQSPVRTGGSGADAGRETLCLARRCEALGFSRYWLAEHHSTNSFAGSAPEVLLPMVAAATRHMRVGTGGVLLTHYSPFKVAEQFRM